MLEEAKGGQVMICHRGMKKLAFALTPVGASRFLIGAQEMRIAVG